MWAVQTGWELERNVSGGEVCIKANGRRQPSHREKVKVEEQTGQGKEQGLRVGGVGERETLGMVRP